MNLISNRALYLALTGSLNLNTDVIKVALLTSAYIPDKDKTTFDNTYEISGTGYVAGGKTLANMLVTQDDSNDNVIWDADDVEWSASTLVSRYAILYNTTRSDVIVGVFDFGVDKVSSSGLFALRWNLTGLMGWAQG